MADCRSGVEVHELSSFEQARGRMDQQKRNTYLYIDGERRKEKEHLVSVHYMDPGHVNQLYPVTVRSLNESRTYHVRHFTQLNLVKVKKQKIYPCRFNAALSAVSPPQPT